MRATMLLIGLLLSFLTVAPSLAQDNPNPLLVESRGGDLWITDIVTGEETQLTRTTVTEINPQWSPDGTLIVYNAREEKADEDGDWLLSSTVAIIEVATGDVETLTCNTDHCSTPLWSPDGRYIAYTKAVMNPQSHTYGAWVIIDLNTGVTTTLLTADVWTDLRDGDWVGNHLVVQYFDPMENDYRFSVFEADGSLIANGPLSDIPEEWNIDQYQLLRLLQAGFVYANCNENFALGDCYRKGLVVTQYEELIRLNKDLDTLFIP